MRKETRTVDNLPKKTHIIELCDMQEVSCVGAKQISINGECGEYGVNEW
jgi:hypothetical protein